MSFYYAKFNSGMDAPAVLDAQRAFYEAEEVKLQFLNQHVGNQYFREASEFSSIDEAESRESLGEGLASVRADARLVDEKLGGEEVPRFPEVGEKRVGGNPGQSISL